LYCRRVYLPAACLVVHWTVVFVTTLSVHVAVLSICIVVVFTSLLPVLLCTGQYSYTVHNKTGSREINTTTIQIESTATCPDKVLTKTTRWRIALQQEQPLRMVKDSDRNMQGRTTDTDILMF